MDITVFGNLTNLYCAFLSLLNTSKTILFISLDAWFLLHLLSFLLETLFWFGTFSKWNFSKWKVYFQIQNWCKKNKRKKRLLRRRKDLLVGSKTMINVFKYLKSLHLSYKKFDIFCYKSDRLSLLEICS